MRADCLPFASVTVRVNGRDLQELQTEGVSDDDAMTATAYIEAVDGAEFDVFLNVERGFAYKSDHLDFEVKVDGARVVGKVVPLKGAVHQSSVNGTIESEGGQFATLKKLKFAVLNTTDENPKTSITTQKLSHLGTITASLTRCKSSGTSYEKTSSSFRPVAKHGIPEKALKGRSISHHAQLGESKSIENNGVANVTYPFGKDPIATYKFHYRSHKDLQNEGIISRSPSPVPLEDRDPDSLTLEEARELARRARVQRTEKERNVKIKQEIKREKRQRSATLEGDDDNDDDDDDDDGDVTITSESDARKRAKNAETVDLTGD